MTRCTVHNLALVALAAFTGCQPEAISTYRVPRVQKPSPRLLGAIAPAGESVWFVKLTGAVAEVAAHEREFEQFIRSVHFKDDPKAPVTWTVPGGWRESPPIKSGFAEQRFATFHVGQEGLKLTVTRLGKEAGNILANVNRWRKNDLNLGPITEKDLAGVTRTVKVNDHTMVDMTGRAYPEEQPEEPEGSADKPTYDMPQGWEPIAASGMRVAAFKVTDGGQSAEVTVIVLGGEAGGRLANINRWRDQIGLPAATADQVAREAKMLESPAGMVVCVDLVGPKARTLGGILVHGGQSWFVKLSGPAELVGKQQPAFEAFVKSLRFGAKQ